MDSSPSDTQPISLACPIPMPSQEAERQAELEQYLQLGALPKAAFEDITAILAQVCETPIAYVSLISNDTQILASERGLNMDETPRAISFCTHTILTPEDVMVIPDAKEDPRFVDNPLVTGPPYLRFYAGAPLVSPRGYALGSLCAMDYKPRQLRPDQLKALVGLSRQVVAQMELQVNVRKLEIEVERRERTEKILLEEKRKSEKLVLNILPRAIAEQLKYAPGAIAERFDDVSILFADLVDFTRLAGKMRPVELVGLLNEIVSEFDGLVERHGLEKIKTIGDAYMAVGGLPNPSEDHPSAIANLAIDMQDAIIKFGKNRNLHLGLRIGINTGPVIAGTIGRMKYAYDLWGDAVNVASRMESAGDTGKIHVNENTYLRIKDSYDFIARGEIPIKGKGLLNTYWLDCPACQDG
ncbi:MAG: adenylate/guanylate cyclase domain-containing protein [Cyanobacteria bacterium P01_F01_bin.153]